MKNCSFCENSKKNGGSGQGVRGWVGGGGGGQGRCERRSEVFVKIQKKNIFLGGGGGRVGVRFGGQCGCERRIEVFEKIKKIGGRGSDGGSGGGVRLVGGGGGFRVDVNAMLGVGGDVGYRDVNQE